MLGTADNHYPQTRSKEGGGGFAAVDDGVYLGRTLYIVSYTKGMDGRGTFEERVEIIGLSVLKSVLKSVYNADPLSYDANTRWLQRECGRQAPSCPDSPVVARAFWSLVYCCSDGSTEDRQPATARLSVASMLRSTLPELNWLHLDRGGRMRALREKASLI